VVTVYGTWTAISRDKYFLLKYWIIIIIIFITFIQGVHDCIAGSNHVSRVYKVTYILRSLFMAHGLLFPTINIFYLNTG